MRILGHIISIHDTNKKKLRSDLPTSIAIIDLDHIQKKVMNNSDYRKLKNKMIQYEKELGVLKQNGGTKYQKIKEQRNNFKEKMIDNWREQCQAEIQKELLNQEIDKVIFVGYDLYPNSFNDKIEINVSSEHQMILDCDNSIYCQNLVKQYLNRYQTKIIEGKFPLKYIDYNYIFKRHQRLTSHYQRLGYQVYSMETIINKCFKELQQDIPLTGKLYLTLPYDVGDEVVVDGNRKKIAYKSINDALNHVNKYPVYLYEVDAEQFTRATENFEISVNIPVIRKKKLMNRPNDE